MSGYHDWLDIAKVVVCPDLGGKPAQPPIPGAQRSTCPDCGQPREAVACAYPYWRHVGDPVGHADWVPPHDCIGEARQ